MPSRLSALKKGWTSPSRPPKRLSASMKGQRSVKSPFAAKDSMGIPFVSRISGTLPAPISVVSLVSPAP